MHLSPLVDIFFSLKVFEINHCCLDLTLFCCGRKGSAHRSGYGLLQWRRRSDRELMHHSAQLALSAVDIPLLRAQCLLWWVGLLPSAKYNLGNSL